MSDFLTLLAYNSTVLMVGAFGYCLGGLVSAHPAAPAAFAFTAVGVLAVVTS
jgi:hypothetical protein